MMSEKPENRMPPSQPDEAWAGLRGGRPPPPPRPEGARVLAAVTVDALDAAVDALVAVEVDEAFAVADPVFAEVAFVDAAFEDAVFAEVAFAEAAFAGVPFDEVPFDEVPFDEVAFDEVAFAADGRLAVLGSAGRRARGASLVIAPPLLCLDLLGPDENWRGRPLGHPRQLEPAQADQAVNRGNAERPAYTAASPSSSSILRS
ncbi:hypothetical protein [Agromyces salentinus]|uniref:Pentapeptide repeat-containing protein n=1 Tax=Agromyces salentinus TaxID=269421 RepID=A0ABP4Z5X8_9MICO|nr:hypothetical protein [Agromyces salentinus]